MTETAAPATTDIHVTVREDGETTDYPCDSFREAFETVALFADREFAAVYVAIDAATPDCDHLARTIRAAFDFASVRVYE
jgi:hypothetical protein